MSNTTLPLILITVLVIWIIFEYKGYRKSKDILNKLKENRDE